jgi:hypothetical protein
MPLKENAQAAEATNVTIAIKTARDLRQLKLNLESSCPRHCRIPTT